MYVHPDPRMAVVYMASEDSRGQYRGALSCAGTCMLRTPGSFVHTVSSSFSAWVSAEAGVRIVEDGEWSCTVP